MEEEAGAAGSVEVQQDADGFVDLTADGGLKKKVITKGSGDVCPGSGVSVQVHYTGTLASGGKKFDSSRDRGQRFSFNIGLGNVIRGWDEGVATFRQGERSILRCSADYGYGAAGHPPHIPPGAELDFDVELFSWEEATGDKPTRRTTKDPDIISYSDDSDDGSDDLDYNDRDFLPQETDACPEENRAYVFEDRLERAEQLRTEANALMKKLDYAAARLTYRRAYYHVDFDELQTFDMQDKHKKMIDDAKLPILLNLAQATLKLAAEYAETDGKQKSKERAAKSVMVYCNAALKIAPDHAKALYRKGLAYEQLSDFEDAYDWLKRARTAMGDAAKVKMRPQLATHSLDPWLFSPLAFVFCISRRPRMTRDDCDHSPTKDFNRAYGGCERRPRRSALSEPKCGKANSRLSRRRKKRRTRTATRTAGRGSRCW